MAGEAKIRRERGEVPERKRFQPGPRLTKRGWVWLESNGRIHRSVRGGRIHDVELEREVQAAAKRTDSRIIQPSGDDVLRMAAEAHRK